MESLYGQGTHFSSSSDFYLQNLGRHQHKCHLSRRSSLPLDANLQRWPRPRKPQRWHDRWRTLPERLERKPHKFHKQALPSKLSCIQQNIYYQVWSSLTAHGRQKGRQCSWLCVLPPGLSNVMRWAIRVVWQCCYPTVSLLLKAVCLIILEVEARDFTNNSASTECKWFLVLSFPRIGTQHLQTDHRFIELWKQSRTIFL